MQLPDCIQGTMNVVLVKYGFDLFNLDCKFPTSMKPVTIEYVLNPVMVST